MDNKEMGMTNRSLQNLVGVFLVASHFLIILFIILLWVMQSGFEFLQMLDTIAVMAPMFAAFSPAILTSILNAKVVSYKDGDMVESVRVFMSVFIPGIFVLVLAIIIIGWVERAMEFHEFKIALAVTETAFGVYVGAVLRSLFQEKQALASENEGDLP